jgi:uncharacterized Tic20 family protein
MLFDVVLVVWVGALLAVFVGGVLGGAALLERPGASALVLALLTFGVPICSVVGMLVVVTLVFIFRLRAATQALQGREYRYPLVGRWG